MDSPDSCLDKKHFLEYPYPVDYQYNSRGFRDAEWPTSQQELQEAIWCVGDSFTAGIGQPFDHIWPQVLSRRLLTRTINVSMDGASNDWICRRAAQIQTEVQPRLMAVMWSYTHRRESADQTLDDEQRRVFARSVSAEDDFLHWLNFRPKLRNRATKVIEFTIPDFAPGHLLSPQLYLQHMWAAVKDISWPRCPETLAEFDSLPDRILNELRDLHGCYTAMRCLFSAPDIEIPSMIDEVIHVTERLDWARDHHHFDILTSQWIVNQMLQRLEALDSSKNHVLPGFEH